MQSRTELNTLLHRRFKDAQTISELRERLRDIEEELHQVFADELAQFVAPEEEHKKVS
ncbi:MULTISPECIES: hypothetical protein [Ferrimonas]|uniref:hypothetical protein n=1 Tax=Ferrimonas TaxID=44011 RepID=UPI000409CA58|nr:MULTISPECIES: hypothetical protein [Ferrimonas]BDY04774.1 hypothetical protein F0521_18150 [Ferrimonas sp. YFM]